MAVAPVRVAQSCMKTAGAVDLASLSIEGLSAVLRLPEVD